MKSLVIKTAYSVIYVVNGKVSCVRCATTGRFVAVKKFANIVNSLIVAGGVACNTMLRHDATKLANDENLPLILPSFNLCTDNGAMIAYAGYLMHLAGQRHNITLEAIPRGKLIPDDFVCFCQ